MVFADECARAGKVQDVEVARLWFRCGHHAFLIFVFFLLFSFKPRPVYDLSFARCMALQWFSTCIYLIPIFEASTKVSKSSFGILQHEKRDCRVPKSEILVIKK